MNNTENNILIAEFMGATFEMIDHTEGNEDYLESIGEEKWLIKTWTKPEGFNDNWGWGKYQLGKWEYHSSWDWLMPVVEKIKPFLHNSMDSRSEVKKVLDTLRQVDINITYNSVIEFIKWYNENKTNH